MKQTIFQKLTAIVLVCALMLTCSGCFNIENGEIIPDEEYVYYRLGVNRAGFITDEVRTLLKEHDIVYYSEEQGILSVDIEEYRRIDPLLEEHLLGYYGILGKEESEKIVQLLGYDGWDDFLTQKQCFDTDGNPSMAAWQRSEYIRLGREHKATMTTTTATQP